MKHTFGSVLPKRSYCTTAAFLHIVARVSEVARKYFPHCGHPDYRISVHCHLAAFRMEMFNHGMETILLVEGESLEIRNIFLLTKAHTNGKKEIWRINIGGFPIF